MMTDTIITYTRRCSWWRGCRIEQHTYTHIVYVGRKAIWEAESVKECRDWIDANWNTHQENVEC